MYRFLERRWMLAIAAFAAWTVVGAGSPCRAAGEPGAATVQERPADTAAGAIAKSPRGRLPAYFSEFVSAEQRQKVYQIQAGYESKISDLERQIAELRKQRDKDVDSVLSPEQLAEVQKKRAVAAAKRKARAAASETAASGTP